MVAAFGLVCEIAKQRESSGCSAQEVLARMEQAFATLPHRPLPEKGYLVYQAA